MPSKRIKLWLGLLWLAGVRGEGSSSDYPLTTDSNCTCFQTNSTTANFFAHHSFFDFRSMAEYAATPAVLNGSTANAEATATNAYFQSDAFTSMWALQSWDNGQLMQLNNSDVSGSDGTLLMVNSPNNIYIERDTSAGAGANATYMVMRTVRLADRLQTAAEMESTSSGFRYLSVRMQARTVGGTGAITAMFTYRAGTGDTVEKVQEADLEIRTRDPATQVQFTNQPSWDADGEIAQATRNVSMPDSGLWSDWATYRMDWTPGSTSWYVNGDLASTITFQAPRDPSQVVFNSWSDGGTWSGNMSYNASAFLQIRWIEMVFNNTDKTYKSSARHCSNLCSIDETSVTGTPVLLASIGGRLQPPWLLLFTTCVALGFAL